MTKILTRRRVEPHFRPKPRYQKSGHPAYNRNHHAVDPLSVGDFALISRDGINWIADTEVSKRLLQPFIGPFEVIAVDSERLNFTLKIPSTLRCHPTFHQSLLRKWIPPHRDFPDRPCLTNDLPPDLHEDGYELFEVETILDSRYRGRGSGRARQFLIRWKGYDSSYDSWEPEEFLATCPDLLSEFLAKPIVDTPDGVLKEQVIRRSPRHLSTGSVSVLRSKISVVHGKDLWAMGGDIVVNGRTSGERLYKRRGESNH